jgi:hypothetical protein
LLAIKVVCAIEEGNSAMQYIKTVAIMAAILLVILACATTHIMSVVAGVFSVASVIVFAFAALFGVATRLRA